MNSSINLIKGEIWQVYSCVFLIFLWFQQSAHWLNPPRKTFFQQRLEDISESVYSSSQKAPLGRSRLPSRDDKTVYGTKTVNGMCFVKQLMKEIAFNSVTHMQIFVWTYRRKSVLDVYVTNDHWSYKTPLFWMLDIFWLGVSMRELINSSTPVEEVEMKVHNQIYEPYIRSHNSYSVGKNM